MSQVAEGRFVKERPIIFSGTMVRAILDGQKTQTRRVMKPQPSEDWLPHSYGEVHKMLDGEFIFRNEEPVVGGWGPSDEEGREAYPCPFGQPGDRLWVRETFASPVASWTDYGWEWDEDDGARLPGGRHRPGNQFSKRGVQHRASADVWDQDEVRWRPSIFMPRWASRILLEVVSVRVERLQDITIDDVVAEGIDLDGEHAQDFIDAEHAQAGGLSLPCDHPEVYPFVRLWDSINAKRGHAWDTNPWVWVVEFRKVEA